MLFLLRVAVSVFVGTKTCLLSYLEQILVSVLFERYHPELRQCAEWWLVPFLIEFYI